MDGEILMSDKIVLPDWLYEGAEVWVRRVHGGWSSEARPSPRKVLRFTAQRVIVEWSPGYEAAFAKDTLKGIGDVKNYELIPAHHNSVTNTLRSDAVKEAMRELRAVFSQLLVGNRIGWDELPDAVEAAELLRNASSLAVIKLAQAADRYGEGSPRRQR